ncbi:MAG: hypothetical protein H0U58_05200 [Chloroflexi bacterium]|nr:hypothetical protein [Chloroflexota bacterium]
MAWTATGASAPEALPATTIALPYIVLPHQAATIGATRVRFRSRAG